MVKEIYPSTEFGKGLHGLEVETKNLLEAFLILLEYTESMRTKQLKLYTYESLKSYLTANPIFETEDFGKLAKESIEIFITEDEAGRPCDKDGTPLSEKKL